MEERVETVERLLPGHRTLWLTFYAGILTAWGALLAMQAAVTGGVDSGLPAALLLLCTQSAAEAGLGSAVLMWALMSLAMMAPTAFPAFRTYADLTQAAASGSRPLAALIGGYLVVWLGFAAIAAVLQTALAAQGLIDPFGRSTSIGLNGLLLVLAGAYQFSPLKDACLSSCRNPLTFFFAHWQPGTRGGFNLGLRLGTVCLGCCWALMLLAFVAGTMNLAFMGLAMVLMTLEKLPAIGAKLSAPLGVFLILAGLVTLGLPLTTINL
ncbi:DUF2182 domain-containing protein [Roseibium sp. M-1]